jgi:hypothetical protein
MGPTRNGGRVGILDGAGGCTGRSPAAALPGTSSDRMPQEFA